MKIDKPTITDYSNSVHDHSSTTTAGGTVEVIEIACSDITTDNAVATNVATFIVPFNCTVTGVVSSLDTVCTGSTHITGVNYDGATMLSTNCSIDVSEYSSLTAATPVVISVATWVKGNKVSIDRVQVGATIAGKGHVVFFEVTRT